MKLGCNELYAQVCTRKKDLPQLAQCSVVYPAVGFGGPDAVFDHEI